jgi:hypothetical protein
VVALFENAGYVWIQISHLPRTLPLKYWQWTGELMGGVNPTFHFLLSCWHAVSFRVDFNVGDLQDLFQKD